MSITGHPGKGPLRVGIPIADLCAGMFCAQGILLALLERESSGKGQWVKTSLLEAQIQMLDFQAARYLKDNDVPASAGNDHPTSIPTGVFQTSDGHINIAAAGELMFSRLCQALGMPELVNDKRFNTDSLRSENRVELNSIIDSVTNQKNSDHWIKILNDAGCPCGPIYSMDQVFADPQVNHLKMATSVNHKSLGPFNIVNQAIKMSRTPSSIRTATPDQGEHTDIILSELNYDRETIVKLRADGTI